MKIYTQCSHCETVFAVTETQMAHKSGWVRCGHCKEPFNAYAQRLSDPVEADSFIDVDAQVAAAYARGVAVDNAGSPTKSSTQSDRGPEGKSPAWTDFELVLDGEEEHWEVDEEPGDDDTDLGEDSGVGPDLDFSAIENSDAEIEHEPPLEGTEEPWEASSQESDDEIRDEQQGPPETMDDSTRQQSDVDEHWSDDESTPERAEPGSTTLIESTVPGNVVDSEGANENETDRSRERVVKPFLGNGAHEPIQQDLDDTQEVTIDPVFTIEESYYDFGQKRTAPGPGAGKVALGVFLILVLIILAGWQVIQRYWLPLSQSTATRPAMVQVCGVLDCRVPPLRDIRMVELVGTSIATHDEVPGALRVTIQLINRAEYNQAYPSLELSLTDREGGVVGRRTMLPKDFLGVGSGKNDLPSRQLISILLDLAVPPPEAVGYEVRIIDI